MSLDATQNIGYLQGDYNVAAKIAHNDMQYTVWGGHTMGKHGGIYEEKDEMFRFPEYWVNRQTQTEEARVSKNRQYIQLKHNNSAGINLVHLRQISSSDYSGDYSSWNHLWTSETLLMGQYNQTFCNKFTLSLQAGIDWLEYRVHGNKYHSCQLFGVFLAKR